MYRRGERRGPQRQAADGTDTGKQGFGLYPTRKKSCQLKVFLEKSREKKERWTCPPLRIRRKEKGGGCSRRHAVWKRERGRGESFSL